MIGPTRVIAGSSGVFVVVRVVEDAGATNPGDPKTGLTAATLDISYWRQGASAVVNLTEADAAGLDDAHDPSDVEEIGLGEYLVHLPDAAVATGADFVLVMATATDCVGYGPTIELTDPVNGLFKSHAISASGNTTTNLRVDDFAGYGDDELNNELWMVYDDSADEWHPVWVTDFSTTNGDATVETVAGGGALPFTPEASTDRVFRTGLNRNNLLAADLPYIKGTAETGTLSTTVATTDLTGYADDELIGRTIIFTAGTANGQSGRITAYANTNGQVSYTTLATAPADGDTFVIL